MRAHGGVNGDRYTLAAHRGDGRLDLVRQRDGEHVLWGVRAVIETGPASVSEMPLPKCVGLGWAVG